MTYLSEAFEWAWAEAHDLRDLISYEGLRAWLRRGLVERGLHRDTAELWADDVLRSAIGELSMPAMEGAR